MSVYDSIETEDGSLVTTVHPEDDDVEMDLMFYEENLEGIDGISMPEPPE